MTYKKGKTKWSEVKFEDSFIKCPFCKQTYEAEAPAGIENGKVKIKCFFCKKEFEVESWQFEI